jgi:hypothetical protein
MASSSFLDVFIVGAPLNLYPSGQVGALMHKPDKGE